MNIEQLRELHRLICSVWQVGHTRTFQLLCIAGDLEAEVDMWIAWLEDGETPPGWKQT